MRKKIASILLIFILIMGLVGCEKKIDTRSITGFDDNEEYISMWVHTIENTPEGEAYKKSVELFNKKYDGKYFLDVEFIPRNESGGGYSDKINAGVMSGDLPDIITVDGPNISAYVSNNIIQPLDGVSDEDKSAYLD
ncbi:MAG: extracellular solute-binding protein, partial [Clostridiales bacterium]